MNSTVLIYMKYYTGILCMSDIIIIGVLDVTTPWQWEPTPYSRGGCRNLGWVVLIANDLRAKCAKHACGHA